MRLFSRLVGISLDDSPADRTTASRTSTLPRCPPPRFLQQISFLDPRHPFSLGIVGINCSNTVPYRASQQQGARSLPTASLPRCAFEYNHPAHLKTPGAPESFPSNQRSPTSQTVLDPNNFWTIRRISYIRYHWSCTGSSRPRFRASQHSPAYRSDSAVRQDLLDRLQLPQRLACGARSSTAPPSISLRNGVASDIFLEHHDCTSSPTSAPLRLRR
jgi:hypothetical protein